MSPPRTTDSPRLYWRKRDIYEHMNRTMGMTCAEKGALDMLEDVYWMRGELPDESTDCARLIGEPDQVAMVETLLARFFVRRRDKWTNPVLDAERKHAQTLSKKRSEAGRRGRAAQLQEAPANVGQLPSNSESFAGRSHNSRSHNSTSEDAPVSARPASPREFAASEPSAGPVNDVFGEILEWGVQHVAEKGPLSRHAAQTFVANLCKLYGEANVARQLLALKLKPVVEPRSWLNAQLKKGDPHETSQSRRGRSAVDRVRAANGL